MKTKKITNYKYVSDFDINTSNLSRSIPCTHKDQFANILSYNQKIHTFPFTTQCKIRHPRTNMEIGFRDFHATIPTASAASNKRCRVPYSTSLYHSSIYRYITGVKLNPVPRVKKKKLREVVKISSPIQQTLQCIC